MMKQKKLTFLLFSLGLCAVSLAGLDDFNLYLKIAQLKSAGKPQIVDNQLFFSYTDTKPVRYVAIAFEHEHYSRIHVFSINKHNVFFLAYPLPSQQEVIYYRLIVDGLWTSDPSNPQDSTDLNGIRKSFIRLPKTEKKEIKSPLIHAQGKVEFYLQGENFGTAFLAGSFNNWDPFMTPLVEIKPGLYYTSLTLPPGRYSYQFIFNGRTIPDPLNPLLGYSAEDKKYSRFTIP